MSYEFKQLSAVESVETISETANVLIEDGGVVKKVAGSEVGGSGSAIMLVTLTDDGDDTYTSDVDYATINSAIASGVFVRFMLNGTGSFEGIKHHCYLDVVYDGGFDIYNKARDLSITFDDSDIYVTPAGPV